MVEALVGREGVVINSMAISEAVPIGQLHEVLGVPDRIVDPAAPAPFGHRNNQIHVYDRLGIYFIEHHWTRLAQSLTFVFWPEVQRFRFSPSSPFAGHLTVALYRFPIEATEAEVIRHCLIPWKGFVRGDWQAKLGKIHVSLNAEGKRLKSGRRSARRRVVSVDVSWPHDPRRRRSHLDCPPLGGSEPEP